MKLVKGFPVFFDLSRGFFRCMEPKSGTRKKGETPLTLRLGYYLGH